MTLLERLHWMKRGYWLQGLMGEEKIWGARSNIPRQGVLMKTIINTGYKYK